MFIRASVEHNEIHLNTLDGFLPEFGIALFHGVRGTVEDNHVFGRVECDLDLGFGGILVASSDKVTVSGNNVNGAVIGIRVASECAQGVIPYGGIDTRVRDNDCVALVAGAAASRRAVPDLSSSRLASALSA